MKKIYQSKVNVSTTKPPSSLKSEIAHFVDNKSKVHCRFLKKEISLQRMPEAINSRGSSRSNRMRCFMVAIDILKKAKTYKQRNYKGCCEYSLKGFSQNGFEVTVHLREETNTQKDRQVFMVSCCYK